MYIYDIFVSKGEKELQPNGKVKVTVPMPADEAVTGYTVYHIVDGGEPQTVPSTYADGKVSFETDGFSVYVFVPIFGNAFGNEQMTVQLLALCVPEEGGTIFENGEAADYSNGKAVPQNTKIALTAVANDGYTFKSWSKVDAQGAETELSSEAAYEFTANESAELRALFEKKAPAVPENEKQPVKVENNPPAKTEQNTPAPEEKPTSIKLDARNAGFTYANGALTTTVYEIGSASRPKIEDVLVFAVYPTKGEKKLTLNGDYTRDLGGLDFTKPGTYTVTYTLKTVPSLRASLTVRVEKPLSDRAMTEAEWKRFTDYTDKTNVKIAERHSSPNDPVDLGAQIMLYQYDGTAYVEDGYFENDENSQKYEGKSQYWVKNGDEYALYLLGLCG